MPQVDIASFSNQIYYFSIIFFFLLYFITKKLLLSHFVVLRMRNLNPIKLLFWRSCLWYYILSFRDKTTARYHYLFYQYFQEFLKLYYYIHVLIQSNFQGYLCTKYRITSTDYKIKILLQGRDINKVCGDVLNDINSK